MSDDLRDPDKAVDFIVRNAPLYAAARAQRIYLEEYRKSKKALLMRHSAHLPIGAQEREAYSHPEYVAHLDALKLAIEAEETLRWQLVGAQTRVDVWRTKSASNRMLDRTTS